MQIFVRSPDGHSRCLDVGCEATIGVLKHHVQVALGIPASEQWLSFSSRSLVDDAQSLAACGLGSASTVQLSLRLRGGKPVKVDIITDHLPCGREVWVDLEADTPMHEVKRKLQAATGVPVAHQKVMLSGIGQLVMGDKRTNVGFSHCGSTDSFYFATVGKQADPAAAVASGSK